MKDSRFIELLNLYVDNQLSPQEARDLEAELHANPARSRTYQQYCRMQRACTVLFENERAKAPASPALARALADADRKLNAPKRHYERRSFFASWRGIFTLGTLATAGACAAFLLFVSHTTPMPQSPSATNHGTVASSERHETTAASNNSVTTTTASETISLAALEPADATAATGTFSLQSLARRLRFPTVTSLNANETGAQNVSAFTPQTNDAAFAWTREMQLRPIRKVSIEDTIANLRRIEKQEIGTTIFRISAPENHGPIEEMTAIEYRR